MLLLRIRKTLDNIVSGNDTQFACLAQIRNPLSVIAQEDMRQATVEIGFGNILIESQYLIKSFDSPLDLAIFGIYIGHIE